MRHFLASFRGWADVFIRRPGTDSDLRAAGRKWPKRELLRMGKYVARLACGLALMVWLVGALSDRPVSFVTRVCAAEAAPEGENAGHATAEAGHESGGVPMDFKADLALWSLVTFLVFLFVLKKLAWGPMIEGLQRREAHILNERQAAEEARQKAEQLLAEHERRLAKVQDEVREMLAQAKREAESAKQEIIQQAQQEAEQTRQRAIADIERARDEALEQLFATLSGQVVRATERVLGRALTDDDQKRLVEEALAELTDGAGRG